jgi:uncharacterized protein YegP (UPF0339 family)
VGLQVWRWRLKADNGKKLAASGEPFSSEAVCRGSIELLKANASKAIIETLSDVEDEED